MLKILLKYEMASGQMVNKTKFSVFFSTNTDPMTRQQLCSILQMEEADEDSKYLGLPNMMQRSKVTTFGFLKDKAKKRTLSWDGKVISRAGKETLVKSIIQALPTYTMSVFLLPLKITKDLERSIERFWWNSKKNDSRSIHWMSWEHLSRHKAAGGMGFRDFWGFNLPMLGKQAWKFITNPNSLSPRLYKARYFPNTSFIEANIENNPSFVWRSI